MNEPDSKPLSWEALPGAPARGTFLAEFSALADGGAMLLALGAGARPYRIILLRSGDEVFAYVNRCAHFGVPLAERIEHLGVKPHLTIRCSVHYARYRWRDGFCEFGDCEGESLLPVPVCIDGGRILIAPAG